MMSYGQIQSQMLHDYQTKLEGKVKKLRRALFVAIAGGTIVWAAGLFPSGRACAQSGPISPEVRALRATNSELMQAWVGARTVIAGKEDEIAILNHKIEELQLAVPRQGNQPLKPPPAAPAPDAAPQEKAQ